jgi:hypothetical protein
MSEQPSESPNRQVPERPLMPGWVPTVIGIVLVVMAALAVYTGLRYRQPTLAGGIIKTRHPPGAMTGGGPPGEPEPGSSLLFPDHAPAGTETASANAVHVRARRGLITNVLPDDAMIYVNGLAIGEARQFNTLDEVYDFPSPGNYTVRIIAPGYREQQFVITADDNAPQEIARIDVKLQRQ